MSTPICTPEEFQEYKTRLMTELSNMTDEEKEQANVIMTHDRRKLIEDQTQLLQQQHQNQTPTIPPSADKNPIQHDKEPTISIFGSKSGTSLSELKDSTTLELEPDANRHENLAEYLANKLVKGKKLYIIQNHSGKWSNLNTSPPVDPSIEH